MISPVSVPLGLNTGPTTVTDANGLYSFTTKIHAANWAVVRLVAQTTGFASWSLLQDGALPIEYGQGPVVSMGLVLVAPGQQVQLNITSAQPNSPVLGQYTGVMSPDLNEVLRYYIPSPNPIGSLSTSPQTVIGSLIDTLASDALAPVTLVVPAGTQSLGILVWSGSASLQTPASLLIQGLQSGNNYFNVHSPPQTGGPLWVTFSPGSDSKVVCRLTTPGAGGSHVDVLASPMPLALDTAPVLTVPLDPRLTPQNLSNVNEAIAAASDSTFLIPGVANQVIYLFDLDLQQDAVAMGPDFRLVFQDTSGTPLHTMSTNQVFPWHKSFRGSALTTGLGVRFHNFSSSATAMRGSLTWSQL